MFSLCPPALIYLVFSTTQIIFDTFKGMYNTALFKFIVMIMITLLLNVLCQTGLGVVSWIIVIIPFIFMTVVVSILLYVFGLKASSGKVDIPIDSVYLSKLSPPFYSSSPKYESFYPLHK